MLLRHRLGFGMYAVVRHTAIFICNIWRDFLKKPRDLEPVIRWGDGLLRHVPGPVLGFFAADISDRCRTEFLGLSFRTPLVAAAFKDDPHMLRFWYQLGLGAVIYKTVMPEMRQGNAAPRIQDLGPAGLINAMGLPSLGVAAVLPQIADSRSIFQMPGPVGVSIGGETPEGYVAVFDALNAAFSRKDVFYEVNISCPNTDEGRSFLAHPELLETLLRHMRSATDCVIGVKLSPDQSNVDLCRFVEILRSIPRTYVNLGNTQYRTCKQVGLPDAALSRGGGGLSGIALFPRTLEMVSVIAPMGVPIMATGGISTLAHVHAVCDAGAVLVGMATALVKNPFVVPRIVAGISQR